VLDNAVCHWIVLYCVLIYSILFRRGGVFFPDTV